jgi:hypothetical protein
VLVEVSVRIDAVDTGDLAVAVVVAKVLPPKAFVVERVLVAVRVRDDDEPQLGGLQQVLDRLVVPAPSVDEVVQQPPVDLRADPLAGVLGRAVENRRAAAVGDVAGRLSDLQREQFAPTVGTAEHFGFDQLRVISRDGVQFVADAAGLVPRSVDLVAGRCLRCRALDLRATLLVPGDGDVVATSMEAVALSRTQDHLGLGHRAGGLERDDVEPATSESSRLRRRSSDGVHVEVVVAGGLACAVWIATAELIASAAAARTMG